MTLRSFRITCFTLLAVSPLMAIEGPQTEATPHADTSNSIRDETAHAPSTIKRRNAAPTRAEMRSMNAEQLDERGDRLRQAKNYLSARDCYREAMRQHPTAAAYNKIAIAELLLMHPGEAEKAAKRAVRKDKQLAEAWNNLGVSYYMRHQLKDATRTYERAISLKPMIASFHNNLAATLIDRKRFDRARAEYRRAFNLDPTFFERASQNGVSAHMSSPRNRAEFSFVMARLFAGTGDLDHALHFLRNAMEDGYPKIDEVYRDQEFASVRNDERFLALMKDRPIAVR